MDVLGKLAELRKKSGLTQSEVAEELGVSRQAVSRWETGEVDPSTENLRRLSKLYGVPMDDLVNGTAPEPEPGPAVSAEQESAKPRKMRWILFAAAVIMVLGILISTVVYIATAEQEPDIPTPTPHIPISTPAPGIPIPIEDLEQDAVGPVPGEFEVDW